MTGKTSHLPGRILPFLFLAAGLASAPAQEYRRLHPLKAEDRVIHPLPLGFTSRSLIPWFGPGEPPAILVTGHASYFPQHDLLYRATGRDGSAQPFSLPADFPLYEPVPFDAAHAGPGSRIGGGQMQALPREDGLFDLIRFNGDGAIYHRNTGKPGSPDFADPYEIPMPEPLRAGHRWVADLTGDGVPDLLVGGLDGSADKFSQYPDWPERNGPWSGTEHPNMGSLPDSDIQPFRGYDIAGNWLGLPLRKCLWWAKGSFDKTRKLHFSALRPVRYGRTDYPVQWQDFGENLSPAVISREGGRYIILFSGPDQVLALPLLGETDGELRTGKSLPLLKDGARSLATVNLPTVIGLGDLNRDGLDDIVIGSGANGRLTVLGGPRIGEFREIGNIHTKGGLVSADTLSVPARADWDGDGFPDVIVGDASGFFSLWRGTRDPLVYQSCDFLRTGSGIIRHRPLDGNLQGEVERAWSYTQPEIFDWDGDGHPDLIANDNEAKLLLYRGNGTSGVSSPQRFMLGPDPLPLAWRTRPAVIPGRHRIAGDDRHCLLFMTWDRKLAIAIPDQPGSLRFENTAGLTYENGSPIILCGPSGYSGRIKLAVADWDEDGRWDIVAGVQQHLQPFFRPPGSESPSSAPYWLRNTGTNERPVFEPARLITFRDGTPIRVQSHEFSAYPTDLDGDGHLDLIFGEDEGFIFHLMRDQLKWDEDITRTRGWMALESRIIKASAPLGPGLLFRENWNYPAGPVSSRILDGGDGWQGPWQVDAALAGIHPPSIRLSGLGKKPARLRRDLARPFSLTQPEPVTLACTLDWKRDDSTDNRGNEDIELLSLTNLLGRPLVTIGTTSDEKIQIRLGDTLHTSATSHPVSGNRAIRIEIDLKPAGQPLAVRVSLSGNPPAGPWELEATAPLEGAVGSVTIAAGKFAGQIETGPLILKVR